MYYVEPVIHEPFKPDLTQWDIELSKMDLRVPIEPVIPPEIKFPFMMVFHRKKISQRNTYYLVACAIFQFCDIMTLKRNLKHKGWPNMTFMFDLPEFMMECKNENRYIFWHFQNWKDIERILSPADKLIVPDLIDLFPCPNTQILDKKGQYQLIF